MPAKKTRELPDLHPPQPGSAACYPDRNNIKAMKKLISKTSVNLGNDSLDYITEQVDKESLIRGSPVKGPNVAMQKDRVRKLQQASWTTGSPNDHTYTTSNTLLDPTGNMGDYTAQMSLAAKKILRNSHLHLGNDSTDYSSSAQSGMVEWTPEVKKDSMEGKKMVKQMKAVISATNCVLGDDKVSYESDATAAFRYDASKVVMASINEQTKNGACVHCPAAVIVSTHSNYLLCRPALVTFKSG